MTTPSADHTERTPLLASITQNGRQNHVEATNRPTASYASVQPYLLQFQSQGFPPDEIWCPESLSAEGDKTAFILLVYLHYFKELRRRAYSVDDVWEEWTMEVKDASALLQAEQRITELWDAFLTVPRTPSEIEHILWMPFSFHASQMVSLSRVIDLYECFPPEIRSHRVLELSLTRTWKYNLLPASPTVTLWDAAQRGICAILTPRVLQAADLSGLLAYLGILITYSLNPPDAAVEETTSTQSFRMALVATYGFARFLHGPSWNSSPFLLAALALLPGFPSLPPSDLGYSIILITLCIHVIQLHMPSPPSPLYLFPFQQALPLATLIWNGFAKIYLPVLLLFLPALLIASILLSLSLADITIFSAANTVASPLEARTVFLMLLVVLLLLLICSLGMLVLVYPFVSSYSSASPWDRYSRSLGLDARQSFVQTVLMYTFPQTQFSTSLYPSASYSSVYARILSLITLLRRIVWWIIVGPLSALLVVYFIIGIFV